MAGLALAPYSRALTGSLVADTPLVHCAAIAGTAWALTFAATLLPVRSALRSPPAYVLARAR